MLRPDLWAPSLREVEAGFKTVSEAAPLPPGETALSGVHAGDANPTSVQPGLFLRRVPAADWPR